MKTTISLAVLIGLICLLLILLFGTSSARFIAQPVPN